MIRLENLVASVRSLAVELDQAAANGTAVEGDAARLSQAAARLRRSVVGPLERGGAEAPETRSDESERESGLGYTYGCWCS